MDDSFRFELWEGWRGCLYTLSVATFLTGVAGTLAQPLVANILLTIAIVPQLFYLAYRRSAGLLLVHGLLWMGVVTLVVGAFAYGQGDSALALFIRGEAIVVAAQTGVADNFVIRRGPPQLAVIELLILNLIALVTAGLVSLNILIIKVAALALSNGILLRTGNFLALPMGTLPFLWLRNCGELFFSLGWIMVAVRVALRLSVRWSRVFLFWAAGILLCGLSIGLDFFLGGQCFEVLSEALPSYGSLL